MSDSTMTEIDINEVNSDQFLREFREKIEKCKELNYVFEDSFLLKFLRSRKFNVECSLQLLKNYVTAIRKHPRLFDTVDNVKCMFEDEFICILPNRNVNGESICVTKLATWDPNKCDFVSVIASTVNNYERATMDEETQVNGVIDILDTEGVGFKQLLKIGFSEAKLLSEMSESTLPLFFKKIFIAFESRIVDIGWAFIKPFLSKEFRERLVFIGRDMKRLHETVPLHLLPKKYGGTAEEYHSMKWFEEIKKVDKEMVESWNKFRDVNNN